MKRYILRFVLTLTIIITGCSVKQTPPSPPTYIKSGFLYKAGDDAVKVDFSLADKDDKLTAADGTVTYDFFDGYVDIYARSHEDVHKWNKIHSMTLKIKASDFLNERGEIIFRSARIPYSTFQTAPTGSDGKVKVTFESGTGEKFTGSYLSSW